MKFKELLAEKHLEGLLFNKTVTICTSAFIRLLSGKCPLLLCCIYGNPLTQHSCSGVSYLAVSFIWLCNTTSLFPSTTSAILFALNLQTDSVLSFPFLSTLFLLILHHPFFVIYHLTFCFTHFQNSPFLMWVIIIPFTFSTLTCSCFLLLIACSSVLLIIGLT